jgi:tRNA 2-selenouridine synthase
LVSEYGKYTKEELKEAIKRIGKRIGGLQMQTALQAIDDGDLKTACEISLLYYDKSYEYGLTQRGQMTIRKFTFSEMNLNNLVHTLLM